MKRYSITFIAVFVALLFLVPSAGFAASKKDAFTGISKKQLKKQIEYVALTPIESPAFVKMPESVKAVLQAELVKRLEKLDFKVLPASELQGIRTQMSKLVGGYQKANGEIDVKKKAAVWDHSQRELHHRHPIDAIVSVRVKAHGAPFEGKKAAWHGTSQKIQSRGDGFFSDKYQGTIVVSSLQLVFFDRNDKPIYQWYGGMEVLMSRNADKLEQLPDNQLWQDKKRLLKSVKLALDPF